MKKLLLKQVHIYTPLIKDGSIKQNINEDFDIDNFLHFPLLINLDGSLWKHGNLYLLSKLKNYTKPSPKTLDSIAFDLKNFKEWCEREDIDYLNAPRRVQRPTYLYRGYLQELFVKGKIVESTLKRRILSVIGFYRYLVAIEGIKFKFPLWEEGISSINYLDAQGFRQVKKIVTTDIGKVISKSSLNLFDNAIIDGGRLHPLSQDKQMILFHALNKISNIEMTLGFLISLTTGARIQTVYTLRLKHFNRIPSDKEYEIRIPVGLGTYCDTKFHKQYTLILPKWVYNKVQIYIRSLRAEQRRDKTKHIFDSEELQYVFLNNRGIPYYTAHNDIYRKLYYSAPNGNAIRQFIHTTLKNEFDRIGSKLDFSFHDLRASFGMNLLEKLIPLVEKKEIKLTKILMEIKERMGHSSFIVTEKYLNFRDNIKIDKQVQSEFEEHLFQLFNRDNCDVK